MLTSHADSSAALLPAKVLPWLLVAAVAAILRAATAAPPTNRRLVAAACTQATYRLLILSSVQLSSGAVDKTPMYDTAEPVVHVCSCCCEHAYQRLLELPALLMLMKHCFYAVQANDKHVQHCCTSHQGSTAAGNTHHRRACAVCCWPVPNDQTEEACNPTKFKT